MRFSSIPDLFFDVTAPIEFDVVDLPFRKRGCIQPVMTTRSRHLDVSPTARTGFVSCRGIQAYRWEFCEAITNASGRLSEDERRDIGTEFEVPLV